MLPVLEVKNLNKSFGKKNVVKNISFSLFEGQIFGFVGPNGAGKSTTIRMITGLTPISSGNVKICGCNISYNYKNAIKNIGAVVEMPYLYPYLTGMQNLKLFAGFYDKSTLKNIPNIVRLVGMENRINEKVSTYSLGMKQRLGIAQALLNKPKLLILDEPTNGLDPNGIVEIRNILKALAEKEKMTIIISSHNLAELEHICDVIGIINDGSIIEYKTMKEVNDLVEEQQKVQFLCNYPNYAASLLLKRYKIRCKVAGDSIILPLKEKYIATVIYYLSSKRVKIYGIKKHQKSLEQIYFDLLNKKRSSTSII